MIPVGQVKFGANSACHHAQASREECDPAANFHEHTCLPPPLLIGGGGITAGNLRTEKPYRMTLSAPRNNPSKSAASALSFAMACSMAFSEAGALVAQIDERGEHIVHGRAFYGMRRGSDGKVIELVFELDHQALGQLFADAGNARELRVVLRADGLHGVLRATVRSAF